MHVIYCKWLIFFNIIALIIQMRYFLSSLLFIVRVIYCLLVNATFFHRDLAPSIASLRKSQQLLHSRGGVSSPRPVSMAEGSQASNASSVSKDPRVLSSPQPQVCQTVTYVAQCFFRIYYLTLSSCLVRSLKGLWSSLTHNHTVLQH